jgi:quercetin dioxygenase-like cupin family protein
MPQGLTKIGKAIYIGTMQPISWDSEQDGKLSENAMRRKLESMGYSVYQYHYPPGTYFPPHTHTMDKVDGVVSGRFKMTMQGKSVVLEAGDMLAVPKGEIHSAEVIGDEVVISLDAVKQP